MAMNNSKIVGIISEPRHIAKWKERTMLDPVRCICPANSGVNMGFITVILYKCHSIFFGIYRIAI